MSRSEIARPRLRLWLFAAIIAPLAHFTGAGYMAVALAAGAILPLGLLAGGGFQQMGKSLSLLEWLWMMAVLAHLLPWAGDYWPSNASSLAVSLTLLGLAAVAGGPERSARICCCLFWVSGLMFAGILLASVKEVEFQWLTPEPGEWSGELIVTLLLPALCALFDRRESGDVSASVVVGVLAVGLGAVLQGTLSAAVALKESAPFFELGRSIGSIGFEPVVAVTMTLGWYCLCSLLFQTSVGFAKKRGIAEGKARIVTLLVTGALLLAGLEINGRALTGISLVLWVLVPMLHPKNKIEKR